MNPRPGEPPAAMASPTEPLLFEVAWEVCAQVGGIYTVLRSKAPTAVRRYGDAYCLIGPYREHSAKIELEPQPVPDLLKPEVEELRAEGIGLHFGRWLITGRPQVLLIDIGTGWPRLAETKYYLWKDHGVNSLGSDHDFDETAVFGSLVAELLDRFSQRRSDRAILAHFHEWQSAAAVPLMRTRNVRVATIFTTHATLVGRALSAANAELYEDLGRHDADAVARTHGFGHRHALEKAASHAADVFSTVSEITAQEARCFLGRRPEAVLPNGLNVERFSAPHEFQELHQKSKDLINDFVVGHFFPSYTFDLDRTLYVFTAGRYEYRNKGLDVFIEALSELNRRMKSDGASATVVAFIVTRVPYKTLNVDTLNRQAMLDEIRNTCKSIQEDMGKRLFASVATGRLPGIEDLLDDYATVRLKRMMYAWRQSANPTIVTHDLWEDGKDPVLCHLRHRKLWNGPDDRVKVIFHPEFMSVTSPLLGMDYDQFVRGCHIGVFPSYYEPWGYTPLECIVRGVPSITSDLAGFGGYVMENIPEHDALGIYVARRRGRTFDATVSQVVDYLYSLTRKSRRDRITLRNRVEGQAERFDWSHLIVHYLRAYDLALAKKFGAAKPG